jgi:hypothetical protein
MTAQTYAIDDGHSNLICDGLPEQTARATAQRIANELGKSVWLYADTEESQEIAPEVDIELESPVGPRIIYPAKCDGDIVDARVPEGWEVDWQTTPADYSVGRKSSPLRARQ